MGARTASTQPHPHRLCEESPLERPPPRFIAPSVGLWVPIIFTVGCKHPRLLSPPATTRPLYWSQACQGSDVYKTIIRYSSYSRNCVQHFEYCIVNYKACSLFELNFLFVYCYHDINLCINKSLVFVTFLLEGKLIINTHCCNQRPKQVAVIHVSACAKLKTKFVPMR